MNTALADDPRTLRNERGESIQITRRCGNSWPEQQYSIELNVLHDRVYPFLSKSGVAVDYAMSRAEVIGLICKLADAVGMACELREAETDVATLLALASAEKIARFDAMACATFSHVDGRDLLAELHPRNTLDIKRRVDAQETWFEGDWLSNLTEARNGTRR